MALKNQTELGLTFGQIISVLSLLLAMGYSWVTLSERMAKNEQDLMHLEKGRIQNATSIETIRRETKQDLQNISDKLDKLLIITGRDNK